jgi:antitoxin component YwqK of YwqJK toxin-antitoxin module
LFDDKGQPVQEVAYERGVQQGLTRVFVDGRLLSEQHFLAGRLHGEATAYSEAGDITMKQQFFRGDIEGETLFLNEGGLVRRAAYRKGLMEGETCDYDRDGVVVQRANYRNNLLEGSLTRYWPDGQVMEVLLYRAGKPVGKPRRFDSKGAELSDEASGKSLMKRLEKLVKG